MMRLGISRLAIICFVGGLAIIGVIVIVPNWGGGGMSREFRDREQVRGIAYAMTLYYKRYNYFPCLTDMSSPATTDLQTARKNGGHPACLALKLLLDGGYIEDYKVFFSPRAERPDDHTLQAMSKVTDPRKDSTWACTYAYDPGHNPNHGIAPFFGSTYQTAGESENHTAHVLTCELVAKEIDPDSKSAYVITVRTPGAAPDIIDNIYADNAAALAWRDSYLQWDVPANLP